MFCDQRKGAGALKKKQMLAGLLLIPMLLSGCGYRTVEDM